MHNYLMNFCADRHSIYETYNLFSGSAEIVFYLPIDTAIYNIKDVRNAIQSGLDEINS